MRLTAQGDLLLWRGQEDSVALRAGASDEKLTGLILEGIDRKPEHHDFTENSTAVPLGQKSSLGGYYRGIIDRDHNVAVCSLTGRICGV